jgi:hypothetical protein
MKMYNVFDTEQDAINAEQVDYDMYIAIHSSPDEYVEQTTRWAEVRQRLDGKWVYPVCDHGIQTHTQEEYSADWFPTEEI